jgi:hypothetical protein
VHRHTFESDSSIGILISSIFVRLLVAFAVVKFVSILVVSARVAFEYESCIASMLNFLVPRVRLGLLSRATGVGRPTYLFVNIWSTHERESTFVYMFGALLEFITSV